MANTMFIANLDLNNLAHVQALSNMIAAASDMAVPYELRNMGAPAQVSAPAPAPAPVQERKPLAPAENVVLAITRKSAGRGKYAFTLGYGAGRAGAKALVKDAGFAWDGDLKAYVGTTAQAKALGLTAKSTEIAVSAQWVQVGRDKAQAKAERKAHKAQ